MSVRAMVMLSMVLGLALTLAVAGQGPGYGKGPGGGAGCCAKRATGDDTAGSGCCRGGGGRGGHANRGGMNADGHHEVIQTLLGDHEQIRREVEFVEGGVLTTTVSDDPELAETIRTHVRQMAARMETGQGVRHWDPLFVELFRHHEAITMELEDVDGGIRVRETSTDPQVQELIRQHATRGVSEFVERGHARARETTPLPDGYDTAEVAERGSD